MTTALLPQVEAANVGALAMARLPVTFFAGATFTRADQRTLAWAELVDLLSRHDVREDKDGRGWSPTKYLPGATRLKANVREVAALVLDVDHADVPRAQLDGLAWLAHTTHSHSPDDPRWRVIIPFTRPVPAADWPDVVQRAYVRFGGVADTQCQDASRFYYRPSCRPGAEHLVEHHDGRALDPDELPALTPEQRDRSRHASRLDVAALLEHGSPNGQRDFDSFRLAAKLRYADVPYEDACYLVQKHALRCTPPFIEWQAKVDSAYGRYAPEPMEHVEPGARQQREEAVWRNKALSLAEKKIGLLLVEDLACRLARGQPAPYDVRYGLLAWRAGTNRHTVMRAVKALNLAAVFGKARSATWRAPSDARPGGWESTVLLTPRYDGVLAGLELLAAVAVPGRDQHGGKRKPRPKPKPQLQPIELVCLDHPRSPVITRVVCQDGGEVLDRRVHFPPRQPNTALPGNLESDNLLTWSNHVPGGLNTGSYGSSKLSLSSSEPPSCRACGGQLSPSEAEAAGILLHFECDLPMGVAS